MNASSLTEPELEQLLVWAQKRLQEVEADGATHTAKKAVISAKDVHEANPSHASDAQSLNSLRWPEPEADPFTRNIMNIVEGMGYMTYDMYPSYNRKINAELRMRMSIQDKATLAVVVGAFVLTLAASLTSAYHIAADPSPVKYYTDPKGLQQRLICPSADTEAFLRAFNNQPSTARLRILGSRNPPTPEPSLVQLVQRGRVGDFASAVRTRTTAWVIASAGRRSTPPGQTFDVSLDLTPFINGDGRLNSQADLDALDAHLETDNPLEVLQIRKRVEWDCWEDMAINVKQRLRTMGFNGELQINFEAVEDVLVYRNDRWQNFARNKITTALILISMVGMFVWIPYNLFRQRVVKIESRFKIIVDPSRYWELINDRLSIVEGFEGARWGLMPPRVPYR